MLYLSEIFRGTLFVSGIICACWVAGSIVGFLPLFGWNAGFKDSHLEQCLFTKVMDYNYLVFLYFATIIFPALVMAAFYAHIYTVVLKQVCLSFTFRFTNVYFHSLMCLQQVSILTLV